MLTVGELKNFLKNYDDSTIVMIKSSYYGYTCTVDERMFEPFDDYEEERKVITIIEEHQKGNID